MYNLPYFKEQDRNVILRFLREHPFVYLTGVDAGQRPVATQVPVFIDEVDGKLLLTGHIMRNTDHHLAFRDNPQALAVFTSPHSYVSASWYSDKRQGSTWNYMSVHARGVIRFLDETALRSLLQRTTDFFENNPHSGANFKDLPAEYIDRMIKAIVAFEMEVQELENVFKLSQNRDSESYDSIIQKLDGQGESGAYIAEQMKRRRTELFK